MIESSDDGFEIDFENEELDSPVARAGAGGFIKLLGAVWETLSVEPVSARRAGEAKLSIELTRLASRYMQEAMTCFEAKAWFASALMGMATMESLLILACIADKPRLLTTKAWTSYHKRRPLPFKDRLLHLDLGNLVKIADELKWFTEEKERYSFMCQYEGWGDSIVEYPEFHGSASASIEMCVRIRDLIHPGRCLREGKKIDDRTAEVALGLFFLNLFSFMHHMGREVVDDPSFKLTIRYSDQMKRLMAARQMVNKYLAEPEPMERFLKSPEAVSSLVELMKPALNDLKTPE
jgi:hypothetical protein